jgi:hypothetical protein
VTTVLSAAPEVEGDWDLRGLLERFILPAADEAPAG